MEGMEGAAPAVAETTDSVTPETADSGATESTQASPEAGKSIGEPTRKAESKEKSGAKKEPQDEEFEELKVGSERHKVSKGLAKIIKDLERGFQSKAQKAAEFEKKYQAIEKGIKENTKAILKQHGVDPDEFAEMTLTEKLQLLEMSPEQRENMELKAKLSHHEQAEKEKAEAAQAEAEAKENAKLQSQMDQEIAEAWKDAALPKDVFFVKQIAAVLHDGINLVKAGKLEEPLTPKQAAAIVKKRFEESQRQILSQMDPEGILKLMGDETFNRLREYDLKRVTSKAAPTVESLTRPGAPASASSERKTPKRPMSEKEYRDWWAKL